MRTKIVYVLVSNENDTYYEQALMSAYSCRYHNPDATILIVCDKDTEKTLCGNRSEIRQYVSEIMAVSLPADLSNVKKSRYLKTTLRQIVEGDYLFVDTDTIIVRSLRDIDIVQGDFAAVPDLHITNSTFVREKRFLDVTGWHELEDTILYNSGVLFVRDNMITHNLYELWHKYWKECVSIGLHVDQTGLRKALYESGVTPVELPGEWNCMVTNRRVMFYYNRCKIVHYTYGYLKAGYGFVNNCHQNVYESGCLSEWEKLFLHDPFTKISLMDGAPFTMISYCRNRFLWNLLSYINRICPSFFEYINSAKLSVKQRLDNRL